MNQKKNYFNQRKYYLNSNTNKKVANQSLINLKKMHQSEKQFMLACIVQEKLFYQSPY